ncbi:BON domain-containing protein [Pseudodesulfovibrio sediminis]|uniref:BON domain-containing protein n=1 Tax=Pseudodesulfovibrio sediminis TaxID=2810563 RepID=A0ABN6EXW4_9BACT|nr:BON domain-containing protein [Pseudodesulfovibrio sediminis]BCS90029.1 hypothetical protein PSDVSF_32710 [Pseudodesulfovibrio sediminis]
MFNLKIIILVLVLLLLPGCAAVPFGIGLIPGAPAYLSSIIGSGQTVYETAMDERSTEQQIVDSIIAGHAQAELYKKKDIEAGQIDTYCYFGTLYLVGEYESQEQLRTIYECVDKVENKRGVISHLYIRDKEADTDFFEEQAKYAELRTQLIADFSVTSTPIEVDIVQGDVILLGVIADKKERDRIMYHAKNTSGVNRVISYLYHQELSGPEPHIMSAGIMATNPNTLDSIPPPSPISKPKTKKRTRVAKKAALDHSVLAISNPDRGR